jgi:hypothetical protein
MVKKLQEINQLVLRNVQVTLIQPFDWPYGQGPDLLQMRAGPFSLI